MPGGGALKYVVCTLLRPEECKEKVVLDKGCELWLGILKYMFSRKRVI